MAKLHEPKPLREILIDGVINNIPIKDNLDEHQIDLVRRLLNTFLHVDDQTFALCIGIISTKLSSLRNVNSFTSELAPITTDAVNMITTYHLQNDIIPNVRAKKG